MLLLTLRGTPFLYMGEELGLEDAEVPPEGVVDPGGRDGCRAPIPWDDTPGHGWGPDPWLPWPPDAAQRSATVERNDPRSILSLYRALLAARRASPALRRGDFAYVDAPDGVLAYRRVACDDERLVVINFEDEARDLALPGSFEVEVDSLGGDGRSFDGRLAPEQALLLRRSPA